ncbi:MAG TPA: hypothetical protein VFN37_04960, partial [Candidatus Baltobacteraceae bacterium]|nr:hypothetical protein [Candidatus Baltobacteraceae bacterium]
MMRFTLIVLLALLASWPAHARAQQVFNVARSPVIRMQMRSGRLTIRTWDKAVVQVQSSVPVRARQFGPQAVADALPPELMIPSTVIQTINGPALLPPESFPLGSVLDSPHDGVVIFGGDQDADVTLTIPQSTALVWAVVGRGGITMQGYRSGTFVTLVHTGGILLDNAGGNGYAEVARGPIFVRNSAFNLIRTRTAAGNIVFGNCNVRQIEASSINGSIAYDNGTFVPGVARFESQNGNVAIGVAGGGARIDAHSSGGRIFAGFEGGAAVSGSPTDAQVLIGSGGPVVTANSQRGGVYLYNGSLRAHGRLQGAWQPIGRILRVRPSEQK